MANPSPADAIELARELVRCRSVTPDEGGALALLERVLVGLGARVERPVFSAPDTPAVENLFATVGTGDGPHLVFAGHTDVVPTGDPTAWSHEPFDADVSGGIIYGRGIEDMKGGIAAFVAALAHALEAGTVRGRVSFLVTGDEEGPAINGTVKLLRWAHERGERFDAALVGEPTNVDALGDTVKIGRRGSLTGQLVVEGTQGHAAYPDRADNAVRGMTVLLAALLSEALDDGTERFQPTNLEVTSVDVGNPATNVLPGGATATFNIRHNDLWTTETLKVELERRCRRAARADTPIRARTEPIRWRIEWREPASPVFLTKDADLIDAVSQSIREVTGRTPELTTGGGTSDARFIKDYCPVVEFGLVGRTMHQIDERVPVSDLEALSEVYARFIERWFAMRAPS